MSTTVAILRVIHIVNAVLMAWPIYALVLVNQRVRLGPPLGDRADTYMENTIKNRTIPCFIFQFTALLSGLGLILAQNQSLSVIFSNNALAFKFGLLLVVMGLLAMVHFNLQPRIDSLFASGEPPYAPEVAAEIGTLRVVRKRVASICMFLVLVIVMLGVQVWIAFDVWLTAILVLAIALFTWRVYSSETPYGWV